jgi:hypothetical protein
MVPCESLVSSFPAPQHPVAILTASSGSGFATALNPEQKAENIATPVHELNGVQTKRNAE